MYITSPSSPPDGAPAQLVELAGTQVALRCIGAAGGAAGDGRVVICLHATGHGGADFLPLAQRMRGHGFSFVLIDWPGQGASPPDATGAPASAWRYAAILRALLAWAAPMGRPLLLGNSIGGAAALDYAAHSADGGQHLAGLVLCNPGGLARLGVMERAAIAGFAAFFRAGAAGAPWFASSFAAYYRLLVLPLAPQRRREIVAAARDHAPVLAQAWASFADARADLRQAITNIRAPMLFAWAKRDRLVSYAASRAAIAQTQAGIVLLRGGHAAFLEDPAAFDAAFLRFAEGLAWHRATPAAAEAPAPVPPP